VLGRFWVSNGLGGAKRVGLFHNPVFNLTLNPYLQNARNTLTLTFKHIALSVSHFHLHRNPKQQPFLAPSMTIPAPLVTFISLSVFSDSVSIFFSHSFFFIIFIHLTLFFVLFKQTMFSLSLFCPLFVLFQSLSLCFFFSHLTSFFFQTNCVLLVCFSSVFFLFSKLCECNGFKCWSFF
jgi:hypothetical protein